MSSESIALDIFPDNLRNCVIKDRNSGAQLYTVQSPPKHLGHTTISRAGVEGTDGVLAVVHYHDMPVLPDTIELHDGEHHGKISVRKWLKPATIVRSLPVHFSFHGTEYTVQLVHDKLSLSLSSSAPDLEPIAVFEGSHHPRIVGDRSSHANEAPEDSTAHITIHAGAQDMKDEAVIALIVLAERLRASGRNDEPWMIVGPGAQIGL